MQEKAINQSDSTHPEQPEEVRTIAEVDRSTIRATVSITPNDAKKDYKRWEHRAVEDIRTHIQPRGFTTTLIPETMHRWISDELAACSSIEDVRDVFSQARTMNAQQNEPMIASKEDLAKSVHSVFQQVAQRGHKGIAALEE